MLLYSNPLSTLPIPNFLVGLNQLPPMVKIIGNKMKFFTSTTCHVIQLQ